MSGRFGRRPLGLDGTREGSFFQTSTQDEWEREFHAWIEAHDRTTPIPSAESLRREWLYDDHH